MQLHLFVTKADTGTRVAVSMKPVTEEDIKETITPPVWQTAWDSDYIKDSKKLKYALKTEEGELIALGAYGINKRFVTVEIIYIESHPSSNPTMTQSKKYWGIGKAMIAFGIALSVNNECGGCVTFDAKTSELAQHYVKDFGAVPIFPYNGVPRFMIEGEASMAIISNFWRESESDDK